MKKPHPLQQYVGTGPAACLATKRSVSIAPEVDLGECTLHSPLQKANKAEPTVALNPRGDVTRNPKTGIPVAPKKRTLKKKVMKKIKLRCGVLKCPPFEKPRACFKTPSILISNTPLGIENTTTASNMNTL